MSDLQLERSVLEAKERDELFAIALALGASPIGTHQKGGPGLPHTPGHRRRGRCDANSRAVSREASPGRSRRAGPTGGQDAAGDSRSEQLELAAPMATWPRRPR